jgi:hypothetical protein
MNLTEIHTLNATISELEIKTQSLAQEKMRRSLNNLPQKYWIDHIEQKQSNYLLLVMLYEWHQSQNKKEDIVNYNFLGRANYLFAKQHLPQLFPDLHPMIESDKKHSGKIKTKGVQIKKKADLIKDINTQKKIIEIFSTNSHSDDVKGFGGDRKKSTMSVFDVIGKNFVSNCFETICLGFMLEMIRKSNAKTMEKFDLILSIKRFCNKYCKSALLENKMAFDDLMSQLEKFQNCIEEKSRDYYHIICVDFPELLYSSKYSQIAPISRKNSNHPYPHQQLVIKSIIDNFDKGIILGYRTRIGSGKTTTFIGIVGYVNYIRQKQTGLKHQKPQYHDVQAMFVCNTDTVRTDVAQQLWTMHIPFGIAIWDSVVGAISYKIMNSRRSCKYVSSDIDIERGMDSRNFDGTFTDDERVVIIASPEIATLILKTPDSFNKYVLFFDEPTIDADVKGYALKHNMSLMHWLPKWTIIASATLREINTIDFVINVMKDKNPLVQIIDVEYNTILIPAIIKTYCDKTITPYNNCKTTGDLMDRIKLLRESHFITKYCAPCIMFELYDKVITLCPEYSDQFNVSNYFDDITSITPNDVALYIIDVLTALVIRPISLSLDEMEDLCKINMTQDINNIVDKIKTFGTTGYDKSSPTLIVTNKPIQCAVEIFSPLLEILKQNMVCVTDMFNQYSIIYNACLQISEYQRIENFRKANKYTRDLQKILCRMAIIPKNNIEDKYIFQIEEKEDNEFVNSDNDDDEIVEAIEEVSDKFNRPKLINLRDNLVENCTQITDYKMNFPEYLQIGTLSHHKKFNTNIKSLRRPLDLEKCNWNNMGVCEEILALLACGVGIYSVGCGELSPQYIDCVKTLAMRGELAYIVSDNSISYGSNHPYSDVYIFDDHFETHSLETFFQTSGRVGREGKSLRANVYLSNKSIIRLFERLSKEHDKFDELKNMKDMFESLNIDI